MNELKSVVSFYKSITGQVPHPPEELLLSYIESRVTPRELSRIEAHLEACSQCREDCQMLRRFAQGIPTAPTPTLVMTDFDNPEIEPETGSAPPPLRLSVAPSALSTPPATIAPEPAPVRTPEPAPPREVPRTPPKKPRKPMPERGDRTRSPLPAFLVPLLFLGVNALGLGAIYGTFSRSKSTSTPVPPATSEPKLSGDTAHLQDVYEKRLAAEKLKVAQLEKRLREQRQAPVAAPRAPSEPPKSPQETLLTPGELALSQSTTSVSVHPTLTWKSVPRAHHYDLELTDGTGKSLLKTTKRESEWRIAAALPRGQSYHWSASAMSRDNQPVGSPQSGDVTIASQEDATRLADALRTLANELERLGYTPDSKLCLERAESLLKK